jgi:hypothetical protein
MFVLIGETLARMDDKLLCDEDGHISMDLDTYYYWIGDKLGMYLG